MRFFHSVILMTLFAGAAAHADTLQTFKLAAILGNNTGTGGSVSGSLVIDTTTGLVSSSSLNSLYGGQSFAVSSTVTTSKAIGNGSAFDLSFGTPGATGSAFLSLVLPVGTLIGYTGSLICYEGHPCSQAGSNYTSSYFAPGSQFGDQLASGSLSLVAVPPTPVSMTPEPSSLALLGTGLVGIAGLLKRKVVSA